MHRIGASLALVLTLCATACTARPAVPGTPSPGPSPSATPEAITSPTIRASAPPSVSAPPSATSPPTARPTFPPETELEALLPDFAGAQYLTKQAVAGEELLTRSGDPIFRRLVELVGAVPDDIEAVTAGGGDVDLLAIDVRGVSGAQLSAGMLAALDERDESQVTAFDVDGVPMHRFVLTRDDDAPAILMRTAGDALVMAWFRGAAEDVAEELLATLLDPELDELLPADIDGHVMTRFSMPAVAVGTAGDVCSFVCPGEPHQLAAVLGVPVEDGDMAMAYSQEAEISIIAFRFPGVPTARLIPARQALFGRGQLPKPAEMTVGGKTVVHHIGEVFGIPGEEEWQYAHDDVLYIVRAEPTDGVPPIVEAVFAALP